MMAGRDLRTYFASNSRFDGGLMRSMVWTYAVKSASVRSGRESRRRSVERNRTRFRLGKELDRQLGAVQGNTMAGRLAHHLRLARQIESGDCLGQATVPGALESARRDLRSVE